MSFKTRRQIVSSKSAFQVHDHSDDEFTYYCSEGCQGHDVRTLDCTEEQKTENYRREYPDNDLPLGAEIAGEANAELAARDAGDAAEMKYLDQLDTMGGIPPGHSDTPDPYDRDDGN